jgi:hypothetical protein
MTAARFRREHPKQSGQVHRVVDFAGQLPVCFSTGRVLLDDGPDTLYGAQ